MNYEDYIDKNVGNLMNLFYDSTAFHSAVDDLSKDLDINNIDKIVGIESRGFILGGAIAYKLGKGFVGIRKEGKLNREKIVSDEFIDYSGKIKKLEIETSSIKAGEKVLMIDDWFETGRQIRQSIKLVEKLNGEIIGISVIVDETNDETKDFLKKYNYKWLVKK